MYEIAPIKMLSTIMRVLFFIAFTLFFGHSFCQTKKELISAIITINSLDGWDGRDDSDDSVKIIEKDQIDGNNYYNFEKLKKLLSYDELFQLTKHENNVLKLYAIRELIEKNDKNLDLFSIFITELNKSVKVRTHEGCIVDSELIYSILYHDYWNHIRLKARKFDNKQNDDSLMLISLSNDSKMSSIDNYIITFDKDVYWLLYYRAFSKRKYELNSITAITNLIYKFNNSYAFEYLSRENPRIFQNIENHYYTKIFSSQSFDTENQVMYLLNFTDYAFRTGSESFQAIILNKLKTTSYWRTHSGWFENTIFTKYKIEL